MPKIYNHKRRWIKPGLTILVRRNLKESILLGCKIENNYAGQYSGMAGACVMSYTCQKCSGWTGS